MMPRLSAQESIDTYNRIAAGTGSFPADVNRQLVQTWSRQAERPEARRRRVVRLRTPEDFASVGLRMHAVPTAPKKGAAAGSKTPTRRSRGGSR